MRRAVLLALLTFVGSAAHAGGKRVEPAFSSTPPPVPPVLGELHGPPAFSITVAGGVSLGAYEAGQLHYLTEIMRMNPELGRLRLVTGASAGSTNGFMTILSACAVDERPVPPRKSAFHRTWIPLGLSQLWSREHDGGMQGAFSREWLARTASDLEAAFDQGLREDCDVVFGVSVTRVVPRNLRAPGEGFELPRVEEKFAVHLQGRGAGRPPRLTNYSSPERHGPQLLLPEGPDGEVPFEALRDLVFASSAFPLAFAPQPLRHCIGVAENGVAPRCPQASATTDLFIDGGLFDNTPLRLAAHLAGSGLEAGPDGLLRWRPAPRDTRDEAPPGVLFAYVSPDAAAYPTTEESARVGPDTAALALVAQVAGAFVTTARAKNLSTLLEDQPSMAERTVVPLRHYPAASSPMAAFLGFFDQSLREFDFTLGAYDARRMVVKGVQPVLLRRNTGFHLRVPDDTSSDPSWRPLDCLRAALGERSGALEVCEGEELASFRILVQASLFRLWDQCSREGLDPAQVAAHRHCRAAHEGRPPVLVPGVPAAASVVWRRGPVEGETEYVLRLLAELGFGWKDLGLEPGEGREALHRIRVLLGDVSAGLVARQPPEDRFVLDKLSGLAANSLAYAQPRWLWWVTFGRQLELGGSLRLTSWRWAVARLHLAAELHGVSSALSTDQDQVGPALLGGLELRPQQLASVTLQPSLILRAGYVLSSRDSLGRRSCPNTYDTAACTRPVVELGLGLSALDVARILVLGEWYPRQLGGRRTLWAVAPALGVQLAL